MFFMRFTRNKMVFVAIGIAVFLLFIVAICDMQPYPRFFWIFAFSLPIIASIFYSILTKKVLNGFLLLISWFILLAAGLEDLLFYLILGKIPASMPHLYDEPWMSGVARFLGFQTVTPISLVISVILGAILITLVVLLFRFLRARKKWPKWL